VATWDKKHSREIFGYASRRVESRQEKRINEKKETSTSTSAHIHTQANTLLARRRRRNEFDQIWCIILFCFYLWQLTTMSIPLVWYREKRRKTTCVWTWNMGMNIKGENRDQNQPSKKKHEASDVLPTDCWRCCSYDQFYNKRVASFHTRKAIDTSQIYLTHILMIDNIDTYVLKERRWNLILLNTKKMFSFVSFSNWEKRERERERRYVHKDMQLDNKQHLVRTQPLNLYNISTEQSLRACPLTRLTDKHKAQVSLKRHDSNIKEISYRPL